MASLLDMIGWRMNQDNGFSHIINMESDNDEGASDTLRSRDPSGENFRCDKGTNANDQENYTDYEYELPLQTPSVEYTKPARARTGVCCSLHLACSTSISGNNTDVCVTWKCGKYGKRFQKLHATECHIPKCRSGPERSSANSTFSTAISYFQQRHAHPALRNRKRREAAKALADESGRTPTVWTPEETALLRLNRRFDRRRSPHKCQDFRIPAEEDQEANQSQACILRIDEIGWQADGNADMMEPASTRNEEHALEPAIGSPSDNAPGSHPANMESASQVQVQKEWDEEFRAAITVKCRSVGCFAIPMKDWHDWQRMVRGRQSITSSTTLSLCCWETRPGRPHDEDRKAEL